MSSCFDDRLDFVPEEEPSIRKTELPRMRKHKSNLSKLGTEDLDAASEFKLSQAIFKGDDEQSQITAKESWLLGDKKSVKQSKI